MEANSLSGGINLPGYNDFLSASALQLALLGEEEDGDAAWNRIFQVGLTPQQQVFQNRCVANENIRASTILAANVELIRGNNENIAQQSSSRNQFQAQILPPISAPAIQQTQLNNEGENLLIPQGPPPKKRIKSATLRAAAQRSYSTHKNRLRTIITTEVKITCEICTDEVSEYRVVVLRCNHRYCLDCLAEMFKRAIASADNYPPRCCEPIPITFATEALTSTELQTFFEVSQKRDANNSTTVYCCRESCGRPLPSHHIEGRIGVCLECNELTCAMCTKKHHGDAWCQDDPDAQALIEVAKKNRWQRCYQCWRIVELKHGCYHITCLCQAQFCYVCGTKWKRCNCNSAEQFVLLGGGATGHGGRNNGSRTDPGKSSNKLWERHRKLEEAYVKEREAQLEGLEFLRKRREKDREMVEQRIKRRHQAVKDKVEKAKLRAEERAKARRERKPRPRPGPRSRLSALSQLPPLKLEPLREIRPKSESPDPVLVDHFPWLFSAE